jgi:hypothetical protein
MGGGRKVPLQNGSSHSMQPDPSDASALSDRSDITNDDA